MQKQLITINEAAKIFDIPVKFIRVPTLLGHLPFYQGGYVKLEEVNHYFLKKLIKGERVYVN